MPVLGLAAGLIACLLLGSGACQRRNVVAGGPATPPTASPVVRGAGTGLEVWSWVISDKPPGPPPPEAAADQRANPKPSAERQPFRVSRGKVLGPDGLPIPPATIRVIDGRATLESLLAPYLSRSLPISTDLRERWRRSGLRIVAVPIADLEPLQQRMRLVGPMQRQWMGELSDWTEVARGPVLDERRAVAIDEGMVVLDPGRLRLAARCWATPAPGDNGATVPAVRLELLPQITPPADPQRRWRAAAGLEPADQGVRFDRLAAGMTLVREEAYIIVADDPEADWERPAAPPGEDSGPAPTPPRPTTLGELMLCAPARAGGSRTRAVIVLVPRIPDRFDLLP